VDLLNHKSYNKLWNILTPEVNISSICRGLSTFFDILVIAQLVVDLLSSLFAARCTTTLRQIEIVEFVR